MSPFEKFIREFAEAHPNSRASTAIREYEKSKPDYEKEPIRWALSVDGVEKSIREGRLVKAVLYVKEAEEGPSSLVESKRLVEQARATLV